MTAHASAGSTTAAGFGTDTGTTWTRIAALTGVLFAVALVGQAALSFSSPSTHASATTIQNYYVSHQGRIGGSGILNIIAVAAGLGFFVYIRSYFRRITGLEWLPSLFFTGAVVLAISGVIGGGMDFALADHPTLMSADSLQTLNTLMQNLGWVAVSSGLCLLYLALGIIVIRTRILPTWLAWLSWLMAALAASFFLAFVPLVVTAIWAIVVGIRLAVRNPSLGMTA